MKTVVPRASRTVWGFVATVSFTAKTEPVETCSVFPKPNDRTSKGICDGNKPPTRDVGVSSGWGVWTSLSKGSMGHGWAWGVLAN